MSDGCLLTILIPLNFAIGCYTSHLKKFGWEKRYIDILVLIAGGMVTIVLIKQKTDPYIPFIFMGGILVGVIQSSWEHRTTEKEDLQINSVEMILKVMEIVSGVILVIIPHTKLFYGMLLKPCEEIVHILCYVVYALWGIEKIIFSGLILYWMRTDQKLKHFMKMNAEK